MLNIDAIKETGKRITNNYGLTLIINDPENLLTKEIIKELKDYDDTVFFNDLTSKHWIFDFKLKDVWFQALEIDFCEKFMLLIVLHAFK